MQLPERRGRLANGGRDTVEIDGVIKLFGRGGLASVEMERGNEQFDGGSKEFEEGRRRERHVGIGKGMIGGRAIAKLEGEKAKVRGVSRLQKRLEVGLDGFVSDQTVERVVKLADIRSDRKGSHGIVAASYHGTFGAGHIDEIAAERLKQLRVVREVVELDRVGVGHGKHHAGAGFGGLHAIGVRHVLSARFGVDETENVCFRYVCGRRQDTHARIMEG